MSTQLKKLSDAGTWELVFLSTGKRAIANKWVYSKKEGAKAAEATAEDSNLHTARLVARGDLQSKGVDYDETFAPVVKLVSLRLLLTHAARKDIDIHHWDIIAAFLSGDLTQEVYMKQPTGFEDGTGRVCKLKKSIYGLCQSARAFYQKLDSVLKDKHWTRLNTEWAMWKDPYGNMIGSHVDDMCVVAGPEVRKDLKKALENEGILVHELGELDTYVGIQITRERERKQIYLYQEEYTAKVLKLFGMEDCHPVNTPFEPKTFRGDPLTSEDRRQYQKLVGCLLYMMHATRPDLSFATIRLSQFASAPLTDYWLALKRLLRYLKGSLSAKLILGDVDQV